MTEFNPDQLETPFFLLDEEVLLNEIATLNTTLQHHWDNYKISYSVKTNSLPYLAVLLKENGVWAEVVSEDEYNTVSAVGYTPDRIICNGPLKSKSWIENLLDNRVLLNVDSQREVEYITAYSLAHPEKSFLIGIRVNLDIESVFPGESNGGKIGSRFGFSNENGELGKVIEQLKHCPNVKVDGLHLHLSTKNRRCDVYRWLVGEFAAIVAQYALPDISYLDIGGGFYGGLPGKPTWNEYFQNISEELKLRGFSPETLTLILEPGVSLLAGCFSYYTRVVDVKNTVRQTFVVCDGSRLHVDPFMHKKDYYYQLIRKKRVLSDIVEDQRLVGFTCLENDCFFNLQNQPPLSASDMIRFDKVGAYTLSLIPLFISYFPAVYIKWHNGNLECIREKWGTKEFLQLSKCNVI